MKKISVALVIVMILSLFALPMRTEAKTIAQFEAEVEKFTAELRAKQNSLNQNKAEIEVIKQKISNIIDQMAAAEKEIDKLQLEIEESNQEIRDKGEESKSIIEYYQISNGENIYLEYAFGATDITDMIYRMSIVEQLTEYNDKIVEELEILIENNKKKQKELEKKIDNLNALETSLKAQQRKVEADSNSIRGTMPSIETQIKEAQAQIKYYKSLKCGTNEDIQDCERRIQQSTGTSLPSVGFFSRPMAKGYVTQYYNSSSHRAYDFSSSNKSEPIYAIAEGTVHAIYHDNCTTGNFCGYRCNGNAKVVVTKHNYNGKYYYATYAHLGSFGNISVGSFVTRNTKIGNMGNTGCSTGPHLHFELATCHYMNKGGCTSKGYKGLNPGSYINIPYQFNNR